MYTYTTDLSMHNGLWFATIWFYDRRGNLQLIIKRGGYTLRASAKSQVTRLTKFDPTTMVDFI